jgi:glycosyltransferase involved in cell wall biosynthesis
MLPISLVVPVRNEDESIEQLIEGISRQTLPPDEIILVDGGSADGTVKILERLAIGDRRMKLIKTDGATPGKGRNIGIEAAANDWIALTDAGIRLDEKWLEELVNVILPPRPSATAPKQGGEREPGTAIVYGNYTPEIGNLFERCAAIAYVPSQGASGIRAKFIASSMLKKQVWEKVGGFPDMRAAEDLMFMEAAEAAGFQVAFAPEAMVHWQLRPNVESTFKKFVLYSKYNVWAGRQWDWHYGIARQYIFLVPFVLLATFHSWWWLFAIPTWIGARTAKRILAHRYEFGWSTLFNPLIFLGVAGLVLLIDGATFIGWGEGVFNPEPQSREDAKKTSDEAR